jgi:hypothetical protein
VASGHEFGRVIASADNQPAALQAWNRFTASLDRACGGLDAESPYRALLDRLCMAAMRSCIVWRRRSRCGAAPIHSTRRRREVVAIRADLDRTVKHRPADVAVESGSPERKRASVIRHGGYAALTAARDL